jgi:hypothetical protein
MRLVCTRAIRQVGRSRDNTMLVVDFGVDVTRIRIALTSLTDAVVDVAASPLVLLRARVTDGRTDGRIAAA